MRRETINLMFDQGWTPDQPPQAGGLFECYNVLPLDKGFRSIKQQGSALSTATATTCIGATWYEYDDTDYIVVGSGAKLEKLNGTDWDDISATA